MNLWLIWWFSCASFHFCSIFSVWKTHVRDGIRTHIPNDCIVTGIIALECSDSNDFNHLCPLPASAPKYTLYLFVLYLGIGLRIPNVSAGWFSSLHSNAIYISLYVFLIYIWIQAFHCTRIYTFHVHIYAWIYILLYIYTGIYVQEQLTRRNLHFEAWWI